MTINTFIKQRPYLVWSTKNYNKLSENAMVEAVLNYADFDDIRELIKIQGIKKTAAIVNQGIKKQRHNYRPEIKNYFQLYFKRYA